MKKSTKGAVAAGGAAVLLMGGAGTLAYWTASDTSDGGSITAGRMTLVSNHDCTAWKYAAGAAGAGTTVTTFVPGDRVTTKCTYVIGANGDHLAATLSAPSTLAFTTAPTGTSFTATVAATYDVNGVPIANGGTITSANDAGVLTVVFDVTLPYGTNESGTPKVNANNMQNVVASLNTLTVSLTQANPN